MHNSIHAVAPSALSWSAHSATLTSIADEEAGDVDEPPDSRLPYSPIKDSFKRNPIRRSIDHQHQSSLLTRALHSTSEDDADDRSHFFTLRRPTKSNASLASTADLTSDTGLTSPSRTNTPSPPLPELRFLNLNGDRVHEEKHAPTLAPAAEVKKEPRKRCIQFACAAKPTSKPVERPAPVAAPAPAPVSVPAASPKPPRKRCIKFACPAPRSTPTQSTPPAVERLEAAAARLHPSRETSPATVRKARPTSHSRSPRPPRSRHSSRGGDTPRKALPQKKYITCTDRDLHHDAARFHEFASDDHSDEDWIRETAPAQARKLTISDTLAKENEIRRLAAEAEAEAEAEEQEDDENVAGIDDEDDEDDDEDDLDDGLSGYATEDEEEDDDDEEDDEDDDSVGYHTDEETGFAASDDENDDLQLWTPAQPAARLSGVSSVPRRVSNGAQSDSSIGSFSSIRAVRFGKVRRMKIRPGTPELPDSTDFVCGTLDEDRPMEEAYISCMAARRREKHVVIPQDIDPSFPASDPEDEAEEEFNPVKHASDDEDVWLHGEMDDLHHETERRSRKLKKSDHSPKRYHSPPPNKRHHSPPIALKTRGRSPAPVKGLFDRRSPRRIRSPPPPQTLRSPPASLRNGHPAMNINKELGTRPGLTVTKSLPRPSAMFPLRRRGPNLKAAIPETDGDVHVRSAIDIVKGLEQKRQRRKEKYYQKYCNRARKGQVHERRPLPGTGCERMRELGLIMAGKIDQGNYVLSI